jgi:hypothetical protein
LDPRLTPRALVWRRFAAEMYPHLRLQSDQVSVICSHLGL